MARMFITGSSDGLGQMAARLLIKHGHQVVLHARNDQRADDAMGAVPDAEALVVGDLSNIAGTRSVADQANRLGHFDAIIHNAAVGNREPRRLATADGLSHVFAINSLAPYILTALIQRPRRLVYLSSGLHQRGDPSLQDLSWDRKKWDGAQAYSDSKLHNVLLAFAIARRWPEVHSNALEPGWVATKMGGSSASDDLSQGHLTQVWLAEGTEKGAEATGGYFYHLRPKKAHAAAGDVGIQERLLEAYEHLSGIRLM